MEGIQKILGNVNTYLDGTSLAKSESVDTGSLIKSIMKTGFKEGGAIENKDLRRAANAALLTFAGLSFVALNVFAFAPTLGVAAGVVIAKGLQHSKEKSGIKTEKNTVSSETIKPKTNDNTNVIDSGKPEQKKLSPDQEREVINKLFEEKGRIDGKEMDEALAKATRDLNGESAPELGVNITHEDLAIQSRKGQGQAPSQSSQVQSNRPRSTGADISKPKDTASSKKDAKDIHQYLIINSKMQDFRRANGKNAAMYEEIVYGKKADQSKADSYSEKQEQDAYDSFLKFAKKNNIPY